MQVENVLVKAVVVEVEIVEEAVVETRRGEVEKRRKEE